MFIRVVAEQGFGIKAEKFANHPIAVGANPNRYGQVMTKFTHEMPSSPSNNNGNNHSWDNHYNSQRFPKHTPGNIFEKPKNDMKVFHFSVLKRNLINIFIFHVGKVKKMSNPKIS